MSLALHFVLCAILGLAFVGLVLYRKSLVTDEDHPLHLGAAPAAVNPVAEKRLATLERYSNILLAVLVIYAVALIGATLYLEWGQITS